ncbi:MAG: response regulator [Rhodospirillaceae bacterium]|nr:response regulator [Rhodospirillaceae bacterium]
MATILLVEDEKSTVLLLSSALTKAGHAVTAAGSGVEALTKVKTAPFDLVIMDMSMPGMSGFEAIRKLKSDPTTRATPILALTGATTAGDRDEAYDAGCDAFENKPIDITRLLARVKEFVTA